MTHWTYSFASKSEAVAACHRADLMAIQESLPHDRRLTRLEARPHAWDAAGNPTRWGVWPMWRYADRPDLYGLDKPDNGGPFVRLSLIPQEGGAA